MRKHFLFIFLSIFSVALYGQSLLNIKHYSVQDGLSQKNIQNFIQDDNGYIWMATWNGLDRFDGYMFRNFKTYPNSSVRITNQRFIRIIKTSLNNIWCLTYDNRLYLFNTHQNKFEDITSYSKNLINSISKVYALKNGISWVVGMQNELYRIDEKKFPSSEAVQIYTNRGNLGNVIYNILQDKDGDEWILTNSGTMIVGSKKIANQMPFQFMLETSDGIYLATSNGFFAKYDKKSKNVLPCAPQKPVAAIRGMERLNDNRIAIFQEFGIIIYDLRKKDFKSFDLPIAIRSNLFQDRSGIIWLLSTVGKVIRLDCLKGKIDLLDYPKYKELPGYSQRPFMHEDEFGTLWIKPSDGELCFYNKETQRLEQASVNDMGVKFPVSIQVSNYLVDRHKNIWYANGDGFDNISFRQKSFEYITNEYSKSVGRAIMEDHRKRLWIGWKRNNKGQDGIVSLYDSNSNWVGNLSKEGNILPDHSTRFFKTDVYCIYEDRMHNVWIGTREEGLFLLRPKGDKSYQISRFLPDKNDKFSISSNAIYSIIQDYRGRIWIGTYGGGINLINNVQGNGKLRFIHSGNVLNNYPIHLCDRVRCFYETKDKVLLIGTTGGLLSFSLNFSRPETIRFYHNVCSERYSSLSNNDVMNISQTRNGKLYFTTLSGGVSLLESKNLLSENLEFKHYNATNGQVPDLSLSTIEDLKGNIWVVSENKLLKFNPRMNLLEEYSDQILMSETKPLLCSSGKLAFGSMCGVLCISPQGAHKSSYVPPIVFSHLDIYLNNASRRQDICSNEAQILGAKERNFTITFAALDYVDSHAIKYAYRIKGLNDHWIVLGNNRSASLVNVPAGDYVFQVKSTNADGVWVDNVTSLPIHIKPTFGETVWAIILYIILAIAVLLIVGYFVMRMTNLKRRVDFEQQLTNLKLRFFTDISHELRTPLTLIASPIEEVISNEKLTEEGMENMQVAKRNTERMLRLINQILDFRKIQNEKMKVYVEQVDVVPLIKKIFENFQPMAHTRNIDFKLSCDIDSIVIYTDVDKLEKILFNLLSNAFKYTSNEKSITLSVSGEKNVLYFSVKDEGRGINTQKINQLFARFETLDDSDPSISTGIGLSLVKELLNLLHGSIKVESKLGEGSLFSVKLPGSYEAFKDDANAEFILSDSGKGEIQKEEEIITDTVPEEKEIRILIIEDNDELRHFISNVLSKDYVVLEAVNGKEGLDITHAEIPDIVVSDIMMPEMDGIEYLKAVKNDSNICHIPIILLSAKSSLNDQIHGLEYGADDYMTKPFSATYLKAKIDSLLKQRQLLYDFYTSNKTKSEKEPVTLDKITPSTPQVTHFDDDFIKNIVQSVEDNIQNPDFRIDDLADAMRMSRTVFYRKVKSLMGVSPVDFVKNMRLKRAIQLLEQETYNVSEVAYMSGFTTPQYFSRVFKEAMNCTPKEYMARKK